MSSASASRSLLAVINQLLKLGLLSRMAERVTFVLIPPLGADLPRARHDLPRRRDADRRRRDGRDGRADRWRSRAAGFDLRLLQPGDGHDGEAVDASSSSSWSARRVFSLTFYGVDGHVWVEHLLTGLPGGQLGFLIVVNILIFVLAFFLDFFELVVHRRSADRAGGRQARHRPGLVRRAARRSTCRPRSCIRRSASRCSTCAASRRPSDYIDQVTGRRIAAGHHRADLLGRGAVRDHPDRDGGPDHRLPDAWSRAASARSRRSTSTRRPQQMQMPSKEPSRTRPRTARRGTRRCRQRRAGAAAKDSRPEDDDAMDAIRRADEQDKREK